MKTCIRCKNAYSDDKVECFIDGSPLVTDDTLVGTTVHGRYVLESVLGRGGMATVYAARHTLINRRCAIKWVSRYDARSSVLRERFKREARAMKRLAHPNIIAIYDEPRETDEGDIYIVMELLEGGTLADLIHAGPIPFARSIPLAVQIARGVARAHDLGVIHRDLKPENIFVTKDPAGGIASLADRVKLLDFGIARSLQDPRLSATGELFGTPQYMAPERLDPDGGDGAAADLYAFGVILYEMLTGFLPFDAKDFTTLFTKHITETPKPPSNYVADLPPRLSDLVLRLLAKKPSDRPVDAHRVRQDLSTIALDLKIAVPPEPSLAPAFLVRAPEISKETQPLRWRRQIDLFARMVQTSFGNDVPWEYAMMLSELRARERRIGELRGNGGAAQRELEEIEAKGRERRGQLGFAVDALGNDASRARDETRTKQAERDARRAATAEAKKRYLEAQREVTYWEGRSGFHAPYAELADAYTQAATAMQGWLEAHRVDRDAEAASDRADSLVSDIEYQLRELRTALGAHENAMDREREACERRVTAATREADELERELANLSQTFCAPLRGRPELRPLFQELENASAPERLREAVPA